MLQSLHPQGPGVKRDLQVDRMEHGPGINPDICAQLISERGAETILCVCVLGVGTVFPINVTGTPERPLVEEDRHTFHSLCKY